MELVTLILTLIDQWESFTQGWIQINTLPQINAGYCKATRLRSRLIQGAYIPAWVACAQSQNRLRSVGCKYVAMWICLSTNLPRFHGPRIEVVVEHSTVDKVGCGNLYQRNPVSRVLCRKPRSCEGGKEFELEAIRFSEYSSNSWNPKEHSTPVDKVGCGKFLFRVESHVFV